MIDIYEIPVYYISFKKNVELEKHLKNRGFKNINLYQAVNGKSFNVSDLKKNNIITLRAYNDLINGREQHSGLSGLGCIGCTMSHHNLWKKCVDEKLPYIIIVENDLNIPENFDVDDLEFINNIITKPNGAFFGTFKNTNKNILGMVGLHFCILSNGACNELIKETFPIDVQTDHYITHMADTGKINIDAKPIAKQKFHLSNVQTSLCVKCLLPNNILFYIGLGVVLVFLVGFYIIKRKMKCNK
jgi:GR25 family glycosyltransferase involved in LPS biosynthesis